VTSPHTPQTADDALKLVNAYRQSLLAHCCCADFAASIAIAVAASFAMDKTMDDVAHVAPFLKKRGNSLRCEIKCNREEVRA